MTLDRSLLLACARKNLERLGLSLGVRFESTTPKHRIVDELLVRMRVQRIRDAMGETR